ncbi:CHAT domain-containing protein [Roseofilum capinflatum]|uniref:CHAT domain-containing protein n=1 Tax=Roseofilum capinflatum BLCC-M114 TaxID=3022440 RepID=A0ABT7B873_9CYAN|nr:CHAT domain-containing protein [Roseofilum capinflatum]MDJ1175377.1 CHAT domain-containing protein [Roseofilum capinflatum BLCC-M114]
MAQVSSEHSDRSPEFWRQEADEYAQNGDFVNQAVALGNLSLALQERGEWEQARESSTQGIQILEQLSTTKERDQILAQSLDIQGKLSFSVGDFSAALVSWQEAGKLYQQLGLTEAEDRNRLNQVQAMQELGLFQSACEAIGARIDENVSFCAGVEQESLQKSLGRVSGDRLTVLHLQALGDVLRLMGDMEVSEAVLKRGLAMAETDQEMLDRMQLSMGNTLRAKGDRQWAIAQSATSTIQFNFEFCPILENQEEYNLALKHYQNVSQNNPLLKLQANLNKLNLQVALNQNILDFNPLEEAQNLNLFNTQSGNNLILNTLQTATCISTIPWQNIAQNLQTIIDVSQQRKDLKTQSYALGYLGRLYEQHAQDSKEYLQTAKTHTQKALSIAQSLDLNAPELAYQWQWQLGRILEKTQSPPHSSETLSAYKAAFNTLQSLRQELVSSNRDLQFSFRDEVEPVYRKYVDLLLQNNPSQDNLKEARNVIEALQLAELDDFFNDACITAKPEQIDTILDNADSETAFIYEIILEDRVASIIKLPQQPLEYYPAQVQHTTLQGEIQQLRRYVSDRPIFPDEVLQAAKKLYPWIIEPLEKRLAEEEKIKTLVFVLDRPLQNIPLGVLYDKSNQEYFLEKDYTIVLSLGLQLIQAQPWQLGNQNLMQAFTGGVGIPQKIGEFDFEAIKELELELNTVSEILKTEQPLIDEQFTPEAIKDKISAADLDIIHFKTHGQFSSDPEKTFIVAYNDLVNSEELGSYLQQSNPTDEDNIKLLVLSACETAQGDNRATLGLAGMAVRSGAGSIISSLWVARDERNTELMEYFYTELLKPNTTRAKAFQKAQKMLFEQHQEPHFWGTYVFLGNWL